MIHPQRLLADLKDLLPKLEQDILDYAHAEPERQAALREEYRQAKAAYSDESGHSIRRKVATRSDRIRPPSPKESGRGFRRIRPPPV